MKKLRTYSAVALLLLIAAAVLFSIVFYKSALIPTRLWIIALIMIVFVVALILFLIFKGRSKFLTVLGGVLALVFSAVLFYAVIFLSGAERTAQSITEKKIEVTSMGVYMNADKASSDTALSVDFRYGILEQQDRENTDKVLEILREDFGQELTVKEYTGVVSLLDALFNDDVDAIVLNSALLTIVDETEGFEDILDRVVEVKKLQIKRELVDGSSDQTSANRKKDNLNLKEVGHSSEESKLNGTFAMYISGIDNRGELIEQSRSDVNIIAVVNPTSHQVLLVSTPRDYYVPLVFPEFVSSRDKLTHAGIYGVQVSIDTLANLYGIDIDYYFRVNFGGFLEIVDALGGVTVEVEKGFSTTEYTFNTGPNELNGYKALSFVRNRFGIGDQQRGRNQMAFIKGVIDKATSTDMLLNFNAIFNSVQGSFETSMPYDVLSSLVREQLDSNADWNVMSYAVTGTGNSAIPYSLNFEVYVLEPDYSTVEEAQRLMQMVYDGEILPTEEDDQP